MEEKMRMVTSLGWRILFGRDKSFQSILRIEWDQRSWRKTWEQYKSIYEKSREVSINIEMHLIIRSHKKTSWAPSFSHYGPHLFIHLPNLGSIFLWLAACHLLSRSSWELPLLTRHRQKAGRGVQMPEMDLIECQPLLIFKKLEYHRHHLSPYEGTFLSMEDGITHRSRLEIEVCNCAIKTRICTSQLWPSFSQSPWKVHARCMYI